MSTTSPLQSAFLQVEIPRTYHAAEEWTLSITGLPEAVDAPALFPGVIARIAELLLGPPPRVADSYWSEKAVTTVAGKPRGQEGSGTASDGRCIEPQHFKIADRLRGARPMNSAITAIDFLDASLLVAALGEVMFIRD